MEYKLMEVVLDLQEKEYYLKHDGELHGPVKNPREFSGLIKKLKKVEKST